MKVTAIPWEYFRYQVQSKSNPNQTHMVDLPDSQCSCISWTCRNKEYKKRTGRDFECCHQKAAWEQLKDDIKAKYGTKPFPPSKPATTNVDARNFSGKTKRD